MNLKRLIFIIKLITLSPIVWGINQEDFVNNQNMEHPIRFEGAPVIHGPVKQYITFTKSENVTINCKVDGDPTPSKTWYKVSCLIIV